MQKLMKHMSKNKVPFEVQKKVQEVMSRKWKSEQGVRNVRHDVYEIYQDIPLRILAELSKSVFSEMLQETDVLHEFKSNDRLIAQICRCLRRKVVTTNEFVILKGETPSDFFICISGQFILLDRTGDEQECLEPLSIGGIFGHVSLLFDMDQPWSIISTSISTMNYMTGRDFVQILSMQQSFCEAMFEHAETRLVRSLHLNGQHLAGSPAHPNFTDDILPRNEQKLTTTISIEDAVVTDKAVTFDEAFDAARLTRRPSLFADGVSESMRNLLNDEPTFDRFPISMASSNTSTTCKLDSIMELLSETTYRLQRMEKAMGMEPISQSVITLKNHSSSIYRTPKERRDRAKMSLARQYTSHNVMRSRSTTSSNLFRRGYVSAPPVRDFGPKQEHESDHSDDASYRFEDSDIDDLAENSIDPALILWENEEYAKVGTDQSNISITFPLPNIPPREKNERKPFMMEEGIVE